MRTNKIITHIALIAALVVFLAGAFKPFTGLSWLIFALFSTCYYIFAVYTLTSRVRIFLSITSLGWLFLVYRVMVLGITDTVSFAVAFCWGLSYLMAAQFHKGDFWAVVMTGTTVLLLEQAVFSVNLWFVVVLFVFLLLLAQSLRKHNTALIALSFAILISLPLLLLLWLPRNDEVVPPVALDQVVKYDGSEKNPISDSRQELEQPLFMVKSSSPAYWRGKVFDYFDGGSWTSTLDIREAIQPQFANQLAADTVEQEITLFANAKFLPAAYQVNSLEVPGAAIDSAGSVIKDIEAPFTYRAVSTVPSLPGNLKDDSFTMTKEKFLQIPEGISPEIGILAEKVSKDGADRWEKAMLISNYLTENFRYNTQAKFSEEDLIGEFLFSKKEGYCVQYASSFVIMARSVGIPARWVLGFTPGIFDKEQQAYFVYGRNAHTWAEVFVSGSGWLPVEATPGFAMPGLTPVEETVNNYNLGNGIYLTVIVVVILVLTLFIFRIYQNALRKRRNSSGPTLRQYKRTGLYGEMVVWLAGRGLAPKSHETPREYAGRAGSIRPGFKNVLASAAEQFSAKRYGNKETKDIDCQNEQQLRREWDNLRQNSPKK
ncbi:DUF3488 and transglutaminase-like domain-containing protein [Metallumcola ferriviriculae]|uniref:DUF3488 and transglutaminase-like domain-containing protein n=1 Tax=Metallumcola ferriviriculae TaxID=3039180 RepID=A0AAU0URR3_9FIRM|nr:DUF3488 and transglutaminase-like domain-containing protein [Desulfitibacteraceae bacterium MK1]